MLTVRYTSNWHSLREATTRSPTSIIQVTIENTHPVSGAEQSFWRPPIDNKTLIFFNCKVIRAAQQYNVYFSKRNIYGDCIWNIISRTDITAG